MKPDHSSQSEWVGLNMDSRFFATVPTQEEMDDQYSSQQQDAEFTQALDEHVSYIEDQSEQALTLGDAATNSVGVLEARLDQIDSRLQAIETGMAECSVELCKHQSRIPRELSVSNSCTVIVQWYTL